MATARYAIIPTHNRLTELQHLIAQLRYDVDTIIIIDNASNPPMEITMLTNNDGVSARMQTIKIIRDEEQPPNLYRLWNVGLNVINEHACTIGNDKWDVGVFNDDAVVPNGWFDIVSSALRDHSTAVVASTSAHGPIRTSTLLTSNSNNNVFRRMCPYAFITRGEVGLRADESFRWWWGDTDFDWQARRAGGVLLLSGPLVENAHANSQTYGELMQQTGIDRETFARKWGATPW